MLACPNAAGADHTPSNSTLTSNSLLCVAWVTAAVIPIDRTCCSSAASAGAAAAAESDIHDCDAIRDLTEPCSSVPAALHGWADPTAWPAVRCSRGTNCDLIVLDCKIRCSGRRDLPLSLCCSCTNRHIQLQVALTDGRVRQGMCPTTIVTWGYHWHNVLCNHGRHYLVTRASRAFTRAAVDPVTSGDRAWLCTTVPAIAHLLTSTKRKHLCSSQCCLITDSLACQHMHVLNAQPGSTQCKPHNPQADLHNSRTTSTTAPHANSPHKPPRRGPKASAKDALSPGVQLQEAFVCSGHVCVA